MKRPARLVVLVGPKGSGKTTIGQMLARPPPTCGSSRWIVQEIEALDGAHRVVVLETTGASDRTPGFLDALRRGHEVRMVRVHARAETCETRIAERDPTRRGARG